MKAVPKLKHPNGVGVDRVVQWVNEVVEDQTVTQIAVAVVHHDGQVQWHRSGAIGSQIIGVLDVLKAEITRDYIDSGE